MDDLVHACGQCHSATSSIYCEDCSAYYCEQCSNDIHKISRRSRHNRINFEIQRISKIIEKNLITTQDDTLQSFVSTVAAEVNRSSPHDVILTEFFDKSLLNLHDSSDILGFVSFVGPSGVGKSALIRMLFELLYHPYSIPLNASLPVRGPGGFSGSTTADLHMFLGPRLNFNRSGDMSSPLQGHSQILFLDSEGINGSDVPSMLRATVDAATRHAYHEQRKLHVKSTFPKLCLSFSDVLCFVTSTSWRAKEEITGPLLDWAKAAGAGVYNQVIRPIVYIIFNKQPNGDYPSLERTYITEQFFAPCPEVQEELRLYFSSVHVLIIPDITTAPTEQLVTICREFVTELRISLEAIAEQSLRKHLRRSGDWYLQMFTKALYCFNQGRPLNLLLEGLSAAMQTSKLGINLLTHWRYLLCKHGYESAKPLMFDRLKYLPSWILKSNGLEVMDTATIELPDEWKEACRQLCRVINESIPCRSCSVFYCAKKRNLTAQCESCTDGHDGGHQSGQVYYRNSVNWQEWLASEGGMIKVACRWPGKFQPSATAMEEDEIINIVTRQLKDTSATYASFLQLHVDYMAIVKREIQTVPSNNNCEDLSSYCQFCLTNDPLVRLDECKHFLCRTCIDLMVEPCHEEAKSKFAVAKDDAWQGHAICPCCDTAIELTVPVNAYRNMHVRGGIRILLMLGQKPMEVQVLDRYDLIVCVSSKSMSTVMQSIFLRTILNMLKEAGMVVNAGLLFSLGGLVVATNVFWTLGIVVLPATLLAGLVMGIVTTMNNNQSQDKQAKFFTVQELNILYGYRGLRSVIAFQGELVSYMCLTKPDKALLQEEDCHELYDATGTQLMPNFYLTLAKKLWPKRTVDAVVVDVRMNSSEVFYYRQKLPMKEHATFKKIKGHFMSLSECFYLEQLGDVDMTTRKVMFHLVRKLPDERILEGDLLDRMGGSVEAFFASPKLFSFTIHGYPLHLLRVIYNEITVDGTLRHKDVITLEMPLCISLEEAMHTTGEIVFDVYLDSPHHPISGSPYRILLPSLSPMNSPLLPGRTATSIVTANAEATDPHGELTCIDTTAP